MPDNMVEVVNKIGKGEGMLDRIHFSNIYKEQTLDDLYKDVDSQNDSSCASNKIWDILKDGSQTDQTTIVYNDTVDNDKIDDLNKKDAFYLHDSLANNNDNNNNNNNNNSSSVISTTGFLIE